MNPSDLKVLVKFDISALKFKHLNLAYPNPLSSQQCWLNECGYKHIVCSVFLPACNRQCEELAFPPLSPLSLLCPGAQQGLSA